MLSKSFRQYTFTYPISRDDMDDLLHRMPLDSFIESIVEVHYPGRTDVKVTVVVDE